MKRFYWAAKAVTQLNQILLLNIEERLNPAAAEPRADQRALLRQGRHARSGQRRPVPARPARHPRDLPAVPDHPGIKGLSARTLRALYNARKVMDAKFRNDPVNHATFRAMLMQPRGITHALRLMNQTSVLGRYLWVFRRIVGQMQHDLFHVYTVDQHILMVLRNVRRFFMAEHAHEYPFCSQLAAGWDKPYVLYIAALFHDIAKGRGGDHSELGAQGGAALLPPARHRPPSDCKLIEFLVREHLTMSRIAQKEDLGDPDVIAAFAKRVGNERYLTALYLLTVADIRGTSPKVWNAWKGKLLEDLYRPRCAPWAAARPTRRRDRGAQARCAGAAAAVRAALRGAQEAVGHAGRRLLHAPRRRRHRLAHAPRLAPRGHQRQGDRAGAPVAGGRRPAGAGLHARPARPVRAHLRLLRPGRLQHPGRQDPHGRNGYALDTFQVVTSMLPEHYRELISMVESELAAVDHRPRRAAAPPSRGRVSRRVKSFPIAPRVDLRPTRRRSAGCCRSRPATASACCTPSPACWRATSINLQLAKVSTLGERVEDTFLIDGPELQQNKRQIEIETELLEATRVSVRE
jgi:[protein-PII] uridylyltransferase